MNNTLVQWANEVKHLGNIVQSSLSDDGDCRFQRSMFMQELLDICNDYGVANDITFNPLKSVCLVYIPAKYKLSCPRVHIGNAQLEYVYHAKYLVFFCEN